MATAADAAVDETLSASLTETDQARDKIATVSSNSESYGLAVIGYVFSAS